MSRLSRFVLVTGISVLLLAACGARVASEEPSARDEQPSVERFGSVGLRLQPVSGITLTSLQYVVTQGAPKGPLVALGNLPSPGTGETVTFGLSLPVGTGYFISLSAESAETGDDVTCSGSYGPFDVAPNRSHALSMVLVCVDNTNGQSLVDIDVDTEACPRLLVEYANAEPSQGRVGGAIKLFSSARDLDNPSLPITYAWSLVDPAAAAIGQFAPVNAANTTFTCHSARDSVLVRVTASNGQCSNSLEVQISCIPAGSCGNGVVDSDETCDTASDPLCPADCTRVCGDGLVELGEACDPLPANPATCIPPGQANECQLQVALCGNGFVDADEECDPLGDLGCSDDCHRVFSPACVQCEQAGDCFASSDNCNGPSNSFTPAQRALCWDVAECLVESGCMTGGGSLQECYCGTLQTAACVAAPFDLSAPGAPNGPCAALMQQGTAPVTSNSAILGALTARTRPSGQASQRVRCQKTDATCAPICGVQ